MTNIQFVKNFNCSEIKWNNSFMFQIPELIFLNLKTHDKTNAELYNRTYTKMKMSGSILLNFLLT